MDCLIAGSAAALKGILLTEEKVLRKILFSTPETNNMIIWSWKDLIENLF